LLTFVENYLALLAPLLTLIGFYPAPQVKVERGRWKVESGKRNVERGKWKVECGKRKVESGKWKEDTTKRDLAKNVYSCSRSCINMHFYPRSLRFSKWRLHFEKSGPHLKKSHTGFFHERAAQKKMRAAGETV